MNHVGHNMIIANYGASQGFDTDDGSSWYDIHDNFMFMADGKLDVFFGQSKHFQTFAAILTVLSDCTQQAGRWITVDTTAHSMTT